MVAPFASAGETPLTAGLFSAFAYVVMPDGVPGRTTARSRPSSWGRSPGTRSLTDQAAAPVQGVTVTAWPGSRSHSVRRPTASRAATTSWPTAAVVSDEPSKPP